MKHHVISNVSLRYITSKTMIINRIIVWVDEIESFYCHLNTCGFEQQYEYGKNTTKYTCKNIDCRCIKDEFLCGKDGSIDLTGKTNK